MTIFWSKSVISSIIFIISIADHTKNGSFITAQGDSLRATLRFIRLEVE